MCSSIDFGIFSLGTFFSVFFPSIKLSSGDVSMSEQDKGFVLTMNMINSFDGTLTNIKHLALVRRGDRKGCTWSSLGITTVIDRRMCDAESRVREHPKIVIRLPVDFTKRKMSSKRQRSDDSRTRRSRGTSCTVSVSRGQEGRVSIHRSSRQRSREWIV